MGGRQRRVTSAEVARAAGVSAATVSYVLNDKPGQTIPAETRERVRAAAARLGYTPYAPARALARGASDLVLFAHREPIIPPSYAPYLEPLADGLRAHGLNLVWQLGYDPSTAIRHPATELAPAVVLHLTEPDRAEDAYLRRFGAPLVVALSDAPPAERPPVLQVRHLAERGHRAVAYAGTADPRLATFDAARRQAAAQTCAELGMPEPQSRAVPPDRAAAREAVRALLATGATGICAYNDETAFAVLAALADLGVPVPAQVAVVGIDDHPLAALYTPALTTVALDDPPTSAADLVRRIVAASRAEDVPPPATPPTAHLIPRTST
ncbi:LacI family DNA-binding transcriptional regulator [Actinocorallia sp. A-T 12471]|uniref:LacI family DNA-binding transcriptional regulator n=1 Tax=Actinocorallia sp. A-T 12471 TaxID=3089813 RepID=UPI0029CCDC5E|nr:LacI family DNA-binding transcriptional regulator [Actinocorallia sp. A-T 12471]MDX6741572.1 LacI family DNA-binding transcriptional regulator [Actinocorallia sp. A-T 12471]